MGQMKLEELEQVTYLNVGAIGSRNVNLMPYWDGTSWHQWIPGPTGLMSLRVIEVEQSDYIAKAAASDSDLWVPFVDLMWQRVSFPEVCPRVHTICDDFHNLFTSVSKIRHFHKTRESLTPIVAMTFAATEIEYMSIVARSIFDIVQEVIAILWDEKILLTDESLEKKRKARKLPRTFSKLVLKDKQARKTLSEIVEEYNIPKNLAAEYIKQTSFFCQLRDIRDNIVHGLGSRLTIFSTEKGFCVDPKVSPFNSFSIWQEHHYYNENLVSLLPLLAYMIINTIDACSSLMSAFATEIQFPPEIAPGYRVFVRGTNSDVVRDLLRSHNGEVAWWEENSTPESNA